MTFEKQLQDPNTLDTITPLPQGLSSQSVKDLIQTTEYPRALAFSHYLIDSKNNILEQGQDMQQYDKPDQK